MENCETVKKTNRFVGKFNLNDQNDFLGDLIIDEQKTLLTIFSEHEFKISNNDVAINGIAYSGESITLIDSIFYGSEIFWKEDLSKKCKSDFFPHYIAIGNRHFNPGSNCIVGMRFFADDLNQLFYDYNAFGQLLNPSCFIKAVVDDNVAGKELEIGEFPIISYFTGKLSIVDVETKLGQINVRHYPVFNNGGPGGVYINNKIGILIKPDSMLCFMDSVAYLRDIVCFLGFMASKPQFIKYFEIDVVDAADSEVYSLGIHISFPWNNESRDSKNQLNPRDVPLDPIRRRDEFENVLKNWIIMHDDWRESRNRCLNCVKKEENYDQDRLIGSANMFDIMPVNLSENSCEISEEMLNAIYDCRQILRNVKPCDARENALDALGRIGQSSLRKKIDSRVNIIESKIPGLLNELKFVTSLAVDCRNFYVHGRSKKYDFEKIMHHIPFLTDTLEFVFCSSDMIESGWDIAAWVRSPMGTGHMFSRFIVDYGRQLEALKNDLMQ